MGKRNPKKPAPKLGAAAKPDAAPKPEPCKTCGTCPTCGHSPRQVVVGPYVYPYVRPWWAPHYDYGYTLTYPSTGTVSVSGVQAVAMSEVSPSVTTVWANNGSWHAGDDGPAGMYAVA